MREKSMRVPGLLRFAVLLPWVAAACGNSSSSPPPASVSNGVDSGSVQGDGGSQPGPDGAQGVPDGSPGQDATTGAPDGGTHPDGGAPPGDGGDASADGASADGAGADGGVRDVGSCCVAQTTPGCSNADLEVCVCEKDQSCCTTAWALPCVLIVQQKYCQAGVRDCVCGTDAGQWAQTSCCSTDWTATCDSVASLKCSAVTGCF
jgi:hypothetical protein